MTTMAENERLAVLESQYHQIQSDVSEIKSDVKALVVAQAQLSQQLAIAEATSLRVERARASTGVWVRTFLPWVVAVLALFMAAMNTFSRIIAQ